MNQLDPIKIDSLAAVLEYCGPNCLLYPEFAVSNVYLNGPILEEGYFKTFPTDRVIKGLSDAYGLQVLDEIPPRKENIFSVWDKEKYREGCVGYEASKANPETGRVILFVGPGQHNVGVLNPVLEKYGYFCVRNYIARNDDIGMQMRVLLYEKKFDSEVTELVQSKEFLYHICLSRVVPKILKNGLKPGTSKNWYDFDNPDRLYLFLVQPSHAKLLQWSRETYFGKKIRDRDRYNTHADLFNYSLLKIDVRGLNEKFYLDPRLTSAVYCTNSIPPNRIEVIDTVEIDPKSL